jgi:hypothetical protein
LEQGVVSQELLKSQIEKQYIRPDAVAVLDAVDADKVLANAGKSSATL